MPNRFASVLIACVLCSGSATALAQPIPPPAAKTPPPNTVAPVTVRAAPRPKVIEKQSQSFVQGYAAVQNPEINQIGRWHDPVCVEVVGLPRADQAAMIKARIESVSQAVGVPAAHAGCRPNVEIVFSDQPQHVMDMVAKRRDYLLGYHHVHNRDRLKTVTRPIQAWYVTATKGDGQGAGPLLFSQVPVAVQFRTEVIDDPDNQPPTGCGDSRLTTSCLESHLHNVFMVADSKALEGKDTALVADYMVMLALSQPRSLDLCNPLPSVIDLFANPACPGRDGSDGLTPADAAYLTALYAADLEAKKKGEQSDIAGRMARILVHANAGGR